VTVQGDFPLREDAWDQMIRLLEVMRPGLVAPPRPESDTPAEGG
jgi:hypothetical protein